MTKAQAWFCGHQNEMPSESCLRYLAGNVTLQSLKLPAHVRVVAWAPQNDIIADEAVAAFVTHGGANSLYEAAYHGTPIVCIPFFADQPDNAAKVSEPRLARSHRPLLLVCKPQIGPMHFFCRWTKCSLKA